MKARTNVQASLTSQLFASTVITAPPEPKTHYLIRKKKQKNNKGDREAQIKEKINVRLKNNRLSNSNSKFAVQIKSEFER